MVVLASLAMALGGCGEEQADSEPPPAVSCAAGELPNPEGGCCPAGTTPVGAGSCRPAGVPDEQCGEGFESDDVGGCSAILPATACPAGTMAVPGETTCREVAPCGGENWDGIPVGPATQYVDGAYLGGDSDGSADRPWTTIQQGVAAAAPAAVVAVAAGTYQENVVIVGKPVALWGRCPADVEVVGTPDGEAALQIGVGADGTEVHQLALTGAGQAAVLSGAQDLLLDAIWAHDTARQGLLVTDTTGPVSATVRGSLVEATDMVGLMGAGADLTIEASVIRHVRAGGTQGYAQGIQTLSGVSGAGPVVLRVAGTVVEGVPGFGIRTTAGSTTIERTVVRDSQPGSQGTYGRGISVEIPRLGGGRPSALLRSTVIERNQEIGLFVKAADVLVESSTIRDTRSNESIFLGAGVWVRAGDQPEDRGAITLQRSLITGSEAVGVNITGSDAVFESTIVRETATNALGELGRGIYVESNLATGSPSSLVATGCVVEQNHELGVQILGSTATIDATVIAGTESSGTVAIGRGLGVEVDLDHQLRSALTLRTSVIDQNQGTGIYVSGSDALIEDVAVRRTAPDATGYRGRGIAPQAALGTPHRASVRIVRSTVETASESGLYVFGADVVAEQLVLSSTAPREADGAFGDGVTVIATDQLPATASLTEVRVVGNGRAGVASFGGHVQVEDSSIDCNPIALNGEESFLLFGSELVVPSVFEDLGGNRCGCGEQVGDCAVLSSGIDVPPPLAAP